MTPAERVASAYVEACRVELQALKPGNVHAYAGGHGMTIADFEASAAASATALVEPGLRVGARLELCVRRTRDAVGCNTNLGILLLCAPLAAAALDPGGGELRDRLRRVLADLDVDDAEHAFAAIRLAAPGGLGDAAEHDVRRPARATLVAAMASAAGRDRIAAQYATGYRDVFELGLTRIEAGMARWSDLRWAASSAFLGFLAGYADSHVGRKHGAERAERVRRAAVPLDAALLRHASPAEMIPALLEFDAALKSESVNPGTSADLTVASLFVYLIERASQA